EHELRDGGYGDSSTRNRVFGLSPNFDRERDHYHDFRTAGRAKREAIMEIRKVGILGCGLMGSGIAQVCAMAGFDVAVLEVEQKYLDKGFAGIEKSLNKFAERPVDKGGITAEQKEAIRARLKGTTVRADLADCDIIIEAIIENLEEKKKMFASLEGIVKTDAILASNTSSISITELLTA